MPYASFKTAICNFQNCNTRFSKLQYASFKTAICNFQNCNTQFSKLQYASFKTAVCNVGKLRRAILRTAVCDFWKLQSAIGDTAGDVRPAAGLPASRSLGKPVPSAGLRVDPSLGKAGFGRPPVGRSSSGVRVAGRAAPSTNLGLGFPHGGMLANRPGFRADHSLGKTGPHAPSARPAPDRALRRGPCREFPCVVIAAGLARRHVPTAAAGPCGRLLSASRRSQARPNWPRKGRAIIAPLAYRAARAESLEVSDSL